MSPKFLTFTICLLIQDLNLIAQCQNTFPQSPASASNDNSVGVVAWDNPNNVFSSNNSRATAGLLLLGTNTNYLVATDFGINVPADAIICGIIVAIEKSATGLLSVIRDNSVRIVKNGIITGSEHAIGGDWPGSDAYFTYGSSSDLWSTTWTAADVNASGFGVTISANLFFLNLAPTARIDHITIIVSYDMALPVELKHFDANRLDDEQVLLNWSTASEINSDFF